MTAIAPVITIDGPSGAGKGTLCKAMAEALQWHLLDSGAIYRVLALAALHHHVDVASEDALVPLASHLDVRFVSTNGNLEVILEGEDVSGEIRTQGGMGGYAEYAFGKSGNFMANYTYGVSLLIANVAIAISAVGYGTELLGASLSPVQIGLATIGVLHVI